MSVIKEKRRGERGAVESDTDIALHACYRKQRSEYTKREREKEKTESEMYSDQRLMYSIVVQTRRQRRDGQHSFYPSLGSLIRMLCANENGNSIFYLLLFPNQYI